jgi:UDP-N-acetylmuramate dehydrogenase
MYNYTPKSMKSQPPTNSKKELLKIQENIVLAPYTTFKIGGPARYFVEVSAEETLIEALQYAKNNNLAVFVLAGGSNVLVSDEGFDGLVIKVRSHPAYQQAGKLKLKIESKNSEVFISCWCGDSLSNLVNFCVENSLTGLAWAAGIPGSIGGAIRGNAGAFGRTIGYNIENVQVLDLETLRIKAYDLRSCNFSYRSSFFKENDNLMVVSARIKLHKGNKDEIRSEIKEITRKRIERQPKEASAGSFFENPVVKNRELVERFEKDKEVKCRDNKLPAGWLISEAGLRGKKMGGAKVSEEHGNFVVNSGNATAKDVITLVSFIKQQVRDKFGVQLKEEVQFVGF